MFDAVYSQFGSMAKKMVGLMVILPLNWMTKRMCNKSKAVWQVLDNKKKD